MSATFVLPESRCSWSVCERNSNVPVALEERAPGLELRANGEDCCGEHELHSVAGDGDDGDNASDDGGS